MPRVEVMGYGIPGGPGLRRGMLLDIILRLAGEEWTRPGDSPIPYYNRLLVQARRRACMVRGWFPPFFGNNGVARALEDKLSEGVRIEIALARSGPGCPEEVEEAPLLEIPVLPTLKSRFPEELGLFWLPGDPRLQFAVVDEKHTLLEEPDHASGAAPAAVARYRDSVWARWWQVRFDKVRDYQGRELLVGDGNR